MTSSSPSNKHKVGDKGFCLVCGLRSEDLSGQDCNPDLKPIRTAQYPPASPSNNLKEQVEQILDDYTALNEGEFKGTTQKWWSFAVEPAANQVVNLILDTILASLPTDKRLHHYGQYTYLEKDILAMLEGLRNA